ncbi:TPA: hypothetical protein U2I12_000715 [Citrobacter farmeri]|uniref:hypothetical protein n=1 Tax=Citrobacter farmeri TaxID=67824 RepID=UPI000F67C8F0|nr:hypothetical protein [Citrobacter farmeri]RSB18606.1 hypothetical protein EGK65_02570 [Citrobacter farmeri]HEM6628073.1 hypothetical protein [Citrobacter farmeri]
MIVTVRIEGNKLYSWWDTEEGRNVLMYDREWKFSTKPNQYKYSIEYPSPDTELINTIKEELMSMLMSLNTGTIYEEWEILQ